MTTLTSAILSAVTEPVAGNPTPPVPAPVAPTATVDLDVIRAEAAVAERTRITTIDSLTVAGCEALIADAKANGWTPGDTATAIIAKIKADGMLDAVGALKTAAATVPTIAADPSEDGNRTEAATPEGPEKWAKDWNASAKLQEEFPTVEAYVAVKRREKPAA